MAKLQNFNGKFCESDYEEAILSYLQEEGWKYCAGKEVFPWRQKSTLFMAQKRLVRIVEWLKFVVSIKNQNSSLPTLQSPAKVIASTQQ